MMKNLIFALLLTLLFLSPAFAGQLDMDTFKRLPVQHDGRIKPLDSFSRLMLKTFSGKDTTGDMTASEWLAEAMFDPLESSQRPVFLVRNENLRHRLGLIDRPEALYSFAELTRGLGKTVDDIARLNKYHPRTLTADERALMGIHENALLYTQILRTFSLILPLNVDLPDKWRLQKNEITYLDLRKIERDVETASRNIVRRKGEDLNRYTEQEKKTVALSYQLSLLGKNANYNQLVRIIPGTWSGMEGEWLSPWAVLQEGRGSPETGRLLAAWKDLAKAWGQENETGWQSLSHSVSSMTKNMAPAQIDQPSLSLEVAFNKSRVFLCTLILYSLAFASSLFSMVFRGTSWRIIALTLLVLSVTLHASGIAVRIILLERPPVSTLYESMLFVSFVGALIGLLLERFLKSGSGILIGSAGGLVIGLLAHSFGEADTLKVLTAVLNTNFWLATHVVCITLGYGWCIAASLFAHMLLLRNAIKINFVQDRDISVLTLLSLMALLFTAIGTILGGIWADQSWGRFWGWDPKENGALLIVLWLVWLMHGKLSGHLDRVWMLAGHAFMAVIVALAWIGVNLLGVGLHSYGFAEGVMTGLGAFTVFEILLIGLLVYKARGLNHAS